MTDEADPCDTAAWWWTSSMEVSDCDKEPNCTRGGFSWPQWVAKMGGGPAAGARGKESWGEGGTSVPSTPVAARAVVAVGFSHNAAGGVTSTRAAGNLPALASCCWAGVVHAEDDDDGGDWYKRLVCPGRPPAMSPDAPLLLVTTMPPTVALPPDVEETDD
jgi:hypothetical protein